jgi:Tfp pilus assembly protein PilF
MRQTLAVLGGLLLLAHASPARGQVVFGPAGHVGWGHRSGVGFAFGGKRFAVRGFIGGGSGVIAPVWGPPAFAPWGFFGGPVSVVAPVGHWVAPPVVVAPPPIVVVGFHTTVPQYGMFGPDDRPRPGTFDPPPAPDPFARRRVDDAVKRGDLLVVRPGGKAPEPPEPPGFARPGFRPAPAEVPKEPKQRAAFEVTQAKTAFASGEYGRASERLADAIAAAPEEPLAYFLLAQARVARGEYAEAVAAIRDGVRHAPDWPAATFRLKELYGPNAAALDEHLGELKKAAAADPNDPTLGFLLGYHLWFLGEKAEAVTLFKRAARQVKDRGLIERFLAEAEGKKA